MDIEKAMEQFRCIQEKYSFHSFGDNYEEFSNEINYKLKGTDYLLAVNSNFEDWFEVRITHDNNTIALADLSFSLINPLYIYKMFGVETEQHGYFSLNKVEVEAEYRNQNLGKLLIQISLALLAGYLVMGEVAPYGKTAMSVEKLSLWYKNQGFDIIELKTGTYLSLDLSDDFY